MSEVLEHTVIDLGTACLERALRRITEGNDKGAMADLRLALRYMRQAGADHAQTQYLIDIISRAERSTSTAA